MKLLPDEFVKVSDNFVSFFSSTWDLGAELDLRILASSLSDKWLPADSWMYNWDLCFRPALLSSVIHLRGSPLLFFMSDNSFFEA